MKQAVIAGAAAQVDRHDVARNKYMENNVLDFTWNNTGATPTLKRSTAAPTASIVGNYWPGPGELAQQQMEPLNNEVVMETHPRSDNAPTSAEVKGWPFPQFAQKKDFGPSETWGVDETFPRSATAPVEAEVANWPYPQFHAAESAPVAPAVNQGLSQMFSETPSPSYGIHETFGRPLKAPTAPEVGNWPTQKEIGWPTGGSSLADQTDEDIAKTEHISPDAYELAHPHVPAKAEASRQSGPPKSAEVANWPFPQYA